MDINYSTLVSTGSICYPCNDMDGMVECPVCESEFCIFCMDGCESCGSAVDFSA